MDLDVKAISAIMKAGRDSGVSELEFGGLKLKFHPHDSEYQTIPGPASPRLSAKRRDTIEKENETQNLEENEAKVREDFISHLRIADPLAYEELLAKGELTNAGQEPERPQA